MPILTDVVVPLAIGAIGSVTSLLVFSFQKSQRTQEMQKAHRVQIATHFVERLADSVQLWWGASTKIEAGKPLSSEEIEKLTLSSIWLPEPIRPDAIRLIAKSLETSSEGRAGAIKLRKKLSTYISSYLILEEGIQNER